MTARFQPNSVRAMGRKRTTLGKTLE